MHFFFIFFPQSSYFQIPPGLKLKMYIPASRSLMANLFFFMNIDLGTTLDPLDAHVLHEQGEEARVVLQLQPPVGQVEQVLLGGRHPWQPPSSVFHQQSFPG